MGTGRTKTVGAAADFAQGDFDPGPRGGPPNALRMSCAVGILALVPLTLVATGASAQSARRAALVLEVEGGDTSQIAPALQGALMAHGYELVTEGELRAAMAFAGASAPLAPEDADQVRTQLGATILISLLVRASSTGAVFASLRRIGAGEPTQRFAECDVAAVAHFAVGALDELETEAIPAARARARTTVEAPSAAAPAVASAPATVAPAAVAPVATVAPAAATAPPQNSSVNEALVRAPPAADRPPSRAGGGGDAVLFGVNALLASYALGILMAFVLELSEDRVALAFVPVAGPFLELSLVDFDDPDQAGPAVVYSITALGQVAGLITFIVGLATRNRGEREPSATGPDLQFMAGPLPEGGIITSLTVTGF